MNLIYVRYCSSLTCSNQSTTLHLGTIKGNVGDQNYTLGPDVDLSKYRAVSVWCKRFSVNFGAARLMPDQAVSEK